MIDPIIGSPFPYLIFLALYLIDKLRKMYSLDGF